MMKPSYISVFNLACNVYLLSRVIALVFGYDYCPPLGPVLPPPKTPAQNAAVQSTISDLYTSFRNTVSAYNTTAVSLSLTSIYEPHPLLDFHYTPPSGLNSSGTTTIDAYTLYRIGSVSKVYTVLAILLLKGKVNWSDPVTKYVPELNELELDFERQRNAITTVNWTDITIGALASQLSGIGRDFPNDLAFLPFPWTDLGFPELEPADIPPCGGTSELPPCTARDFFRYSGNHDPVYAPFTTPVYSNIAYGVLGVVIEAVIKKSFEDHMQQSIFEPLGLTHTSVLKPVNDSWGVIPDGDSWWDVSLGFENPSGGLYTNTRDFLSFGRSILQSRLLTPPETRAWLKPMSHTSSLGFSVGAPWEILRSNSVTGDGRVIDFYTKNGGVGEYGSQLVLVPDYGLVLTILVAGGQNSPSGDLLLQTINAILPAIEQASKDEAASTYAGTYAYQSGGTQGSGTIQLSVDQGPGLRVSNWTRNGKDILQEYAVLLSNNGIEYTGAAARLYPTDLTAGTELAWRAVLYLEPADGGNETLLDTPPPFYVQSGCDTWSGIDGYVYGYKAFDEFITRLDDAGTSCVSVESQGLRVTMQKIT